MRLALGSGNSHTMLAQVLISMNYTFVVAVVQIPSHFIDVTLPSNKSVPWNSLDILSKNHYVCNLNDNTHDQYI
jgi:hypothetical protein